MKLSGIILAAAAAALAGCTTAPVTKVAAGRAPPAASNEVPYHWTLGNAPQAHKDMVAEFGKVGLKPGEYLWATAVPAAGETRIVIDLLTQMTYVYRGDKLLGASSMSSAKTGHDHALRQLDDPREAAVLPVEEIRQCADAVHAAHRRIRHRLPRRREPGLSRRATAASACR